MAAIPSDTGIQHTIREWSEGLRHYLGRKLASIEDTEDLTQEACYRLLCEFGKNNEIRNPRAYLYQIAHHLLYHHYTSSAHAIDFNAVDVETLVADDADLERSASDALRIERINRAWRELPPKCQRVLQLRWREGLRVKEICAEMGLSQGMVKKYLARGLTHFRTRLGRYVDAA